MADDDGDHMDDEDGSGTPVKGNLHYNVDGDRDDRDDLDDLDDRVDGRRWSPPPWRLS